MGSSKGLQLVNNQPQQLIPQRRRGKIAQLPPEIKKWFLSIADAARYTGVDPRQLRYDVSKTRIHQYLYVPELDKIYGADISELTKQLEIEKQQLADERHKNARLQKLLQEYYTNFKEEPR